MAISQTNLSRFSVAPSLLLACFFSFALNAQEVDVRYDWQLEKNEEGIQVYTSAVAGSKYRAVRSVSKAKTSVASAVALVEDLAACSEWADLCVKSELIESISATESYIYTYNNVPFPVKDRDVVSHVIWQHDSETGKVSMYSTAIEGKRPLDKKAIRITEATAQWHFTPIDDGQILIENYAHINPTGPTPAWLTNLLLVGSPYKTMMSMLAILESGRYSDAENKFLAVSTSDQTHFD